MDFKKSFDKKQVYIASSLAHFEINAKQLAADLIEPDLFILSRNHNIPIAYHGFGLN